jgi:hypothetical protein
MVIFWPAYWKVGVNLYLSQLPKSSEKRTKIDVDRWNEGLENHERLKKLLPFLNEDEGYL